MSGSPWIKLSIHPEHPKVLRLAELTGRPADTVFACIVRWFRHVDQHCATAWAGIGPESFHRIVKWRPLTRRNRDRDGLDLAEAMQDPGVAWLEVAPDGALLVPEFEESFAKNSKRRAAESKRKSEFETRRIGPGAGENADSPAQAARMVRGFCAAEKEEEKEEEKDDDEEADRAAVAAILDAEGFGADDPIREHHNCTATQLGILQRNADVLKQSGQLRNGRRAYFAAGIRAAYPLDERAGAAERAASARTTRNEAADRSVRDRQARLDYQRAEAAAFHDYLNSLAGPERDRVVADALADMPETLRQKNAGRNDPKVEPLRGTVFLLWRRDYRKKSRIGLDYISTV